MSDKPQPQWHQASHTSPPIPNMPFGEVTPNALAKLPPAIRDPYLRHQFQQAYNTLLLQDEYHYHDGAREKLQTLGIVTAPYHGESAETTVDTTISGSLLTLINPDRIMPQTLMRARMPSAIPEVNELTGDPALATGWDTFFRLHSADCKNRCYGKSTNTD